MLLGLPSWRCLRPNHNNLVLCALCLPHPTQLTQQTRKLCVDVAALLFSRSRVFRQLLTQHFTTFVELSVGHRLVGQLVGLSHYAT